MIKGIILILLVLVIADAEAYLSKEQVALQFQSLDNNKSFVDSLNKGAAERLDEMAKESEFFPKDLLPNLREIKKSIQPLKGAGIDLRTGKEVVESQWGSTCTAHGLSACINNKVHERISTRHIWSAYEKYSCDIAIKAWTNRGCITGNISWPHEKTIPISSDYYKTDKCKTKLIKSTYLGNNIQSALISLDKKNPVYFGTTVSRSMINCDTTIKGDSRKTNGGHALAIIGYQIDSRVKGGGYFIIQNSWSDKCGDRGFQYLPFFHCQRGDTYCLFWSIDSVIQ